MSDDVVVGEPPGLDVWDVLDPPDEVPGPSLEELVAGAGVGPQGVLLLDRVDPVGLGRGLLLALVGLLDRQTAWLAARRARLLAALAPVDADGAPVQADDWVREELAAATGVSPGAAHGQLTTARALVGRLPATLARLEAGELDERRARALAETTAELTGEQAGQVEARVLARSRPSLAALRAAARRAVAAVDPAGHAARCARAAARRSVQREPLDDGMGALHAVLPGPDLDLVWGYLETEAGLPTGDGDERDVGARRADALVALVRAALTGDRLPAAGPARPLVQVVIDLPDLLGLRDGPATLLGTGPLPAPLARALAADADWQRLVRSPVTGHLLDLGHDRYRPSTALRAYLQARDRRCRFPGCRRPAPRCHTDHAVPYPVGRTAAINLQCLCTRHHRLKHEAGWHVRLHPDGAVTWTSPTGRRYSQPPPDAHPDE